MSRAREVTVDLGDGEELRFRYDFNTVATIEELTGVNMLEEGMRSVEGAEDGGAKMNACHLRAVVYALEDSYHRHRKQEPMHDLFQVGSLMTGNLGVIMPAIQEVMGVNLPQEEVDELVGEGEGNPAAPEEVAA